MKASRPLRVALTGGIATGKSFIARELAARGVPIIDADVVAREVVQPGSSGLRAIVERFGSEMVDPSGALDRRALGARVFADTDARRALEAIVHPRVYEAIATFFDSLDPEVALAVADIPLLYETGRHGDFDHVIVAACPRDEQERRLMRRDGLALEQARQRIAAQWPIDRKVAMADDVIWTTGAYSDTRHAIEKIVLRLRARTARGSR